MIWVGRLISIAVILQSLEFFWIRFYPAHLLAPETPRPFRFLLRHDRAVLVVRLAAALAALFAPSPALAGILLLTTWWLGVRWRGTFNGGSDILTFHILAAWTVSLLAPSLETACTYYVGVQVILSYFVAGLAKAANPEWRNGRALCQFGARWGLSLPAHVCLPLSCLVLAFEILFPFALVLPVPFLICGGLFHLANTYVFGLNRFLFVWLAGYPAVVLIAHQISAPS